VRSSEGFDQFYRATGHRVLSFLYGVGGDLSEAQDATQEAFIRAWQHWEEVENYADPEQWVRGVGWRILANRWRKLRGRVSAYRRHGVPEALPGVKEDTVVLVAALRKIPTEQRIALVLHHLLDIPVADVAEQVGVPVGTVKARLSRGRQALALLLGTAEPSETHHV
jgi:RNA polymerase sigma-70 factor (ECF subfamily)